MKRTVTDFLFEFKRIVSVSGLVMIDRKRNVNGLAALGISKPLANNEIMALTYQEYSAGPEPDDDSSRIGAMWVFGKEINGVPAYIKLKLDEAGGNKIAKCISFHPAEYPMSFPLK